MEETHGYTNLAIMDPDHYSNLNWLIQFVKEEAAEKDVTWFYYWHTNKCVVSEFTYEQKYCTREAWGNAVPSWCVDNTAKVFQKSQNRHICGVFNPWICEKYTVPQRLRAVTTEIVKLRKKGCHF